MRKKLASILAICALVAWIVLFVNSFSQFEKKTNKQAYAWHISWADRR